MWKILRIQLSAYVNVNVYDTKWNLNKKNVIKSWEWTLSFINQQCGQNWMEEVKNLNSNRNENSNPIENKYFLMEQKSNGLVVKTEKTYTQFKS